MAWQGRGGHMSRLSKLLIMSAEGRKEIGTEIQGGYIGAYVSYDGGATVYALIVAPVSAERGLFRHQYQSAGLSSMTDGWANRLVAGTTTGYASAYCMAYRGGGFSDWYFAAFHELGAIFESLNPVPFCYTYRTVSTIAIPVADQVVPQTFIELFRKGGAQAFGSAPTTIYGTSTGGEHFGGQDTRYYASIYFGHENMNNGNVYVQFNDRVSTVRPIRKVLASTL